MMVRTFIGFVVSGIGSGMAAAVAFVAHSEGTMLVTRQCARRVA